MMKISIAVLCTAFTVSVLAQTTDPVIMTIGGKSVNKSEFESVYRKNNSKTVTDPKSVKEYADLFSLFKMKVYEAESMGLDTVGSFKTELAGYRRQLATPYLTDKNTNENLITEAYERMKWEIKSSHILIRCSEIEFPKDTLESWTRATLIRNAIVGKLPTAAQIAEYDKLLKNSTIVKSDFAKKDSGMYKSKLNSVKNLAEYYKNAGADKFPGIAPKTSDDPSVPDNKGDLGYYSALDLAYPYETAMYNTKPGEVSHVVRSKYGYHIIKVYDKRPYRGEITVAHIMVKFPKDATDTDKKNAKTKIDELAAKIKAGEKFDDVARSHSEDKQTSDRAGQLAPFKSGKLPKDFEDAAFGLKKDGDISDPVMTTYGWHIIKRIELKGLAPLEQMKPELKARVARDSRSQMGRVALIARVKKENGFKQNLANRDEIMKVLDTTYLTATWKASNAAKLGNKEIISFKDKTYGLQDFAKFFEQQMVYRSPTDLYGLMGQAYEKWVEEMVVSYEDAQLENTRPEFKNLLHEYRDGILLFDLTDQKVWSKAVKDTAGLRSFYEKNKNNYLWDDRADVTTYRCLDSKISAEVRKMLAKGKSEKEITDAINKTSQLNVTVENVMYLKNENKNLNENWKKGVVANDIKDEKDGKMLVIVVNKVLPKSPKTLNEAKGLITADFQVSLEKEWIAYLKNKYPVKINEDVLNTIK
ncbi:MAG TPA: peptidylprolyl isomerase [Bacteroidia bacterium]|jgi:peptidyl-prolyl cis-trans isomerase SurA|nr:peptidylprolyl isomerase [Bacteroidia bacterium]